MIIPSFSHEAVFLPAESGPCRPVPFICLHCHAPSGFTKPFHMVETVLLSGDTQAPNLRQEQRRVRYDAQWGRWGPQAPGGVSGSCSGQRLSGIYCP